jgi:transposase
MENVNYFCGVDISKDTLDVAVLSNQQVCLEEKIPNDEKAISLFFQKTLKSLAVGRDQLLICFEHTGMYGNKLLKVAQKRSLKICPESPIRIKRSQGMVRGKNDKIDARRIAEYAIKNFSNLKLWQPERHSIEQLKALLIIRERLVKIKTQLQVPIQEASNFVDPSIYNSLKASSKHSLSAVKKDIKAIEKRIRELVKTDQKLNRQLERATSVPGIGHIIALNMIVTSGEFNRIDQPKSFACHAGVAPFEHSSGTSIRGKNRVSKLANMRMKKLLHLEARSAVTWNEELKNYYNRKKAQGKSRMSVLNAVGNKLITRVYACIKQDRNFIENLKHPLA